MRLGPTPAGFQPLSPQAVQLVDRFEQAWQGKTPPRIEEFLSPAPTTSTDLPRQALLKELIKIDLEYRWRQQPSDVVKPPESRMVEGYIKYYPELTRLESLLLQVIGEEYRARHRWGDRPSHSEYSKRFATQWVKLRDML